MKSKILIVLVLLTSVSGHLLHAEDNTTDRSTALAEKPNILFCIADDWGWPHAGAYDDPVVKTPTFNRIAREGILFENAFITSPSCTPSRNSILTGQYHWRLGAGGNLHSILGTQHQSYVHLLQDSGYFTGHWRKSWGPGKIDNWLATEKGHPAGKKYKNFDRFLDAWPRDKPFCFWLGASDPHRPYERDSGKNSGIEVEKIKLFDHYPDSDTIRSDVADYYFEVQRFDQDVNQVLKKLEALNLLENTIVVMTGDHGMPFPRCKANLYDSGARVPMAVRWPKTIKPGRTVTDFISTADLAPTFLEAAGIPIPKEMTGKSWMTIFKSTDSGRIESSRDHVITGKERHVPCQDAGISHGTPMRAIRTDRFLLIHNYEPDRWPSGTPNYATAFLPGCWLGDCDNGPTKTYMVDNQDKDEEHRRKYDLAFAKRPEYELYDMRTDPTQMNNVADELMYAHTKVQLLTLLGAELVSSKDPRALGKGPETFDNVEYFGGCPRHPSTTSK